MSEFRLPFLRIFCLMIIWQLANWQVPLVNDLGGICHSVAMWLLGVLNVVSTLLCGCWGGF